MGLKYYLQTMELIVPDKFVYPARRMLLKDYIPIAIGNQRIQEAGLHIPVTGRNYYKFNELIRKDRFV